MPVMHWSEKMSVGVPELDDDHKQLIAVINRLGTDSADDERRAAVRQSLIALLRYAEFHFAREEKVMAACKFPGIEEHRVEHREFVEKIRQLDLLFDDDPVSAAAFVRQTLLDFLRDWLNHHILIEDKAYQPFAANSREAHEAAKSFRAIEVWWSR